MPRSATTRLANTKWLSDCARARQMDGQKVNIIYLWARICWFNMIFIIYFLLLCVARAFVAPNQLNLSPTPFAGRKQSKSDMTILLMHNATALLGMRATFTQIYAQKSNIFTYFNTSEYTFYRIYSEFFRFFFFLVLFRCRSFAFVDSRSLSWMGKSITHAGVYFDTANNSSVETSL